MPSFLAFVAALLSLVTARSLPDDPLDQTAFGQESMTTPRSEGTLAALPIEEPATFPTGWTDGGYKPFDAGDLGVAVGSDQPGSGFDYHGSISSTNIEVPKLPNITCPRDFEAHCCVEKTCSSFMDPHFYPVCYQGPEVWNCCAVKAAVFLQDLGFQKDDGQCAASDSQALETYRSFADKNLCCGPPKDWSKKTENQ